MERLEGPTLNSPEVAALSIDKREALGKLIASCWFEQVLHDGFFHADPHPANIVYVGGGKIGLLDFGMAGSLRADDLGKTRLVIHVMQSDIAGIKRSLKIGHTVAPSADELVTRPSKRRSPGILASPQEHRHGALFRQVFASYILCNPSAHPVSRPP